MQKKTKCNLEENLKSLHPVAKVDLNGLSLATKYSEDTPNLLLSSDEIGNVYIIDSLETENYKENDIVGTPIIFPKKIFKCHNGAVFDIDWHANSKQFLTASGDSMNPIWDIEKGLPIFQSLPQVNSIRTIKSCIYNQSLFISGGRDGKLILWDIRIGKNGSFHIQDSESKENDSLSSFIINGFPFLFISKVNKDSYTGVNFYGDDQTLISSQANKEYIKIWDLRRVSLQRTETQNKYKIKKNQVIAPPVKIDQHSYIENKVKFYMQAAESLKNNYQHVDFHYYLDFQKRVQNLIQKYSLINLMEKNKKTPTKGVGSLYLNKNQDKILVNHIDHTLQLFSIPKIAMSAPCEYSGHKTSYYVKVVMSPCSNFILSGSIDKNLYMWKTKQSKPFIVLQNAHNGDINGVDWGLYNTNFIVSSGDDKVLLIWDYS